MMTSLAILAIPWIKSGWRCRSTSQQGNACGAHAVIGGDGAHAVVGGDNNAALMAELHARAVSQAAASIGISARPLGTQRTPMSHPMARGQRPYRCWGWRIWASGAIDLQAPQLHAAR